MSPSIAAPSPDGKGESSPGFAMELELQRKVTNHNAGKRASALVLQVDSTARDACMEIGRDKLMGTDAVGQALQVLLDHFASDALDAAYQGAVRFFAF